MQTAMNSAAGTTRPASRAFGVVAAVAASVFTMSAFAAADTAISLVSARVDDAPRATMPGRRAAWATAAHDRGGVADTTRLDHLSLVLRRTPERQRAFEQMLADQHAPASPEYQHWLSPSEIGQRFGASDHDLAALRAWLESRGLQVDGVDNSRMRVDFSGAAGKVAGAFSTSLRRYSVNGDARIANVGDPSLPAALAPIVATVNGLTSVRFKSTLRVGTPRRSNAAATSHPAGTNCNGTQCDYSVFPADFTKIYNLAPTYAQGFDGSGQTIAIVARTRANPADVTNFQEMAGLATRAFTETIPNTGVDPGPAATTCSPTGTPSCTDPSDMVADQGETTLDIERATSVAPGASINVITSGVSSVNGDGVQIATEYAIDHQPLIANVLSISYTSCEAQNDAPTAHYVDSLFAQAAMEGISVFVASGDGGVAGCAALDSPPTANESLTTNLLCASSHVTCVGGTEFADATDPSRYWSTGNGAGYESALGYIPEGVWNDPLDDSGATQVAASGGGVSAYIAPPSWQAGLGPSGSNGRLTPDVSLAASTREGYFTCFAAQNASCVVDASNRFRYLAAGGTSASTPSMAGIAALLNQKTGAAQGNLNPRLYALATSNGSVFHDVTVASSGVAACSPTVPSLCNNATPGVSGLAGGLRGYVVGAGYDLATGLGSVDASALLANWSTSAAVGVNLDQRGLTGAWANPATPSQGFALEFDPDVFGSGTGLLFGGWFTFDTTAAGGTRWYTLQGNVTSSTSATIPIFETVGGRFDSAQATTTTAVGQAVIAFSDCTHGSLAYSFSDGSHADSTIPLTRLSPNVSCAPTGSTGAAPQSSALSGAWADVGNSGQGLIFDVSPGLSNLFAAWYTFSASASGADGAPAQRWYTLQAAFPADASSATDFAIYASSGGVFDQSAATTTAAVGTASISFATCATATLTYQFTSGENAGQQGSLDLQRLGPVPTGCSL